MAINFSKNRSYTQIEYDLAFETIYRIARMYIVDKEVPLAISKELDISYTSVRKVIEAKKQHSLWLDAIAALGREGLIDD
jgi:hypothetical protein